MSVMNISETLGCEQSAVSHNLKQLLMCHFVTVKQAGKERIYTVNGDTVVPLLQQIEHHIEKYCIEGCEHWE